jgi:hypothetical protein
VYILDDFGAGETIISGCFSIRANVGGYVVFVQSGAPSNVKITVSGIFSIDSQNGSMGFACGEPMSGDLTISGNFALTSSDSNAQSAYIVGFSGIFSGEPNFYSNRTDLGG